MYAIRIVRDFVNKSSLFFLPIFLFNFGPRSGLLDFLPVTDFQQGMIAIAVYFLVHNVFNMALTIPSGKVITKIGIQRTFTLSYVLRLLGFSCLYLTLENPYLIIPAMLFEGMQSPLFWNSYHTTLSRVTMTKHVGQDLGVLHFLLQFMAVIMPAAGGFLAAIYGMEILFLVGLIGTLLGVIFALLMDIKSEKDAVSFKEFRKWFKERQFKQLAASYAGRYINDAVLFLWPLYVFILLGAVDRVGYLYTISLFIAMMLSFFIGYYIDHSRNKKPFFATGGFLSLLWLARTQITSIFSIAFVDVFERIAANFHWLFFDSIFIKRGKGGQALSYFVYREVVLGFSGVVFWTIFALFFYLSSDGWNALFIFAAVGVLLSLLVRDKSILLTSYDKTIDQGQAVDHQ